MSWINDMWSRKTASEIPFELTGDGSDAERDLGKSQEIHKQLAEDHKAISTGMDEALRHAERLSKQFANNPQMLAQLSKILNKIHNDTEGNQISMSDHMRALRGLTSGYGHYDRLDAYHFLTEPEFETQKAQRGYKPTYLGSSRKHRYAAEQRNYQPNSLGLLMNWKTRYASERPDINMYEMYGKCSEKGCDEPSSGPDTPACKKHSNKK